MSFFNFSRYHLTLSIHSFILSKYFSFDIGLHKLAHHLYRDNIFRSLHACIVSEYFYLDRYAPFSTSFVSLFSFSHHDSSTTNHCSYSVDVLCTSTSCQNGGTCFQSGDNNAFLCLCSVDFEGNYCQTRVSIGTFVL